MLLLLVWIVSLGATAGAGVLFSWYDRPIEYLYLLGVLAGAWIACVILFLLFAVVVSLTIRIDRPVTKRNRFYCAVTVAFLKALLQLLRVKVQVNGMEKLPRDRRFLLVGNHRTNFDPIILMAVLHKYDLTFVTKKENIDIPVGGKFIHAYGCQSLDRASLRNAAQTANRTAELLKNGFCSIGIYPEGGTNRTKNPLRPFKDGSFAIAQRAGVPLVVTCMQGMNGITVHPFRRTKIQLDILSVVDAQTVTAMKARDLCRQSYDQILACLNGEAIPPIVIPSQEEAVLEEETESNVQQGGTENVT